MTDRVLSVRLQLEVAAARRAAKEFAGDLRSVGSAADGAGKGGIASLTGLGRAAVSAGKAAATVGGLAAGGMAVTTAAVLKGGMAYNTLGQTSRAALTTLLGSASAATNQMEALREFGKTSPFPRQVWIAAQQQLLAFGMSAEKIIPTFQAIQDGVAAAGGGGQQISEVVNILAQVQSTGKVGADTLNELGYRGIDAATLIGNAMGKTAAQVRADVSSSAISGVDFIDQLTAAMEDRFSGAAAGVKATWAGATDRIKGAVRDIGGLLAAGLIAPTGGGAAVDWANAVADALRALESRLEPVMAALQDRAGPIFDAITAKLQALATWIRTADFSELGHRIQSMLPALAGVSAGFATMGAKSLPIIGNLVSGLKPLPVALAAAALASPELRQALMDLLTAAAPLLTSATQLTTTLASALGPALSAVAALLQPVIAVVGFLAERFVELPGLIQMVIVGFIAWKALGIGSWLLQNVTALRAFGEQMRVQQALAAMSGQQIGTMGAAYSAASARVSAASIKMRGAFSSAASFLGGPWGIAIGVAAGGLALLAGANADAAQAEAGHRQQVETLSSALRDSKGAIDEHVAALALQRLEETGAAAAARELGIPITTLTQAYLGNKDALAQVQAALQVYLDQVEGQGQLEGQVAGQNPMADKAHELKQILNDLIPEMNQAKQKNEDYEAVIRATTGATEGASNAYAGLAGQLGVVGSATDDVATRTQQLNAVLGAVYDSQFALQASSDKYQGGLQALKNAFANNDKAAVKSAGSADKYSDSIKRQQKIIRDTTKQLQDLAEAQKKAEEEAAEAAKNARQRALDELFGKTFNVQATQDQFQSALAQAGSDVKGSTAAGARDLSGISEGALANRERMRSLVQAAQAAIQAERDQGASKQRIAQVTADLSDQLDQQAASWGLNTAEVRQYSDAVRGFGNLALQDVIVDLSQVQKEFADQRKEIRENSAEQLDNARASAASASAAGSAASATKIHTAALTGNSESAIENRELMRARVKEAQDELLQMHLNGAGSDELTAKGQEQAAQLEALGIQLGFSTTDMKIYTDAIRVSAQEVARYPVLTARADTAGAMVAVQNFVNGVNAQMARIQKSFSIGVYTGSEYINSMAGGKIPLMNADGGFISGPGGPREDKILSWLSNGEYVVNAQDTAKNRPMLERINAGQDPLPRFSAGGHVDPITLNFQGMPSTGLDQLYNGIMGALAPYAAYAAGPVRWAASQAGKPYIWGGVGPAGYDCCLVPGTLVYGPDGATPIESVRAGDRVYSYVDGRLEAQSVTAQWQSKRQQVFKVRTRNRAVVGSANHPFLRVVQTESSRQVKGGHRGEQVPARFDTRWARLDELQPGDLLVQPRKMPAAVKPHPILMDGTEISEDIAWLIGAAVGDGTVTGRALRLCLYGEKRERAGRIARATWGCNPTHGDSYGLIISSVALARSLDAMGMRVLGPDKQVPEAVWQWAPELQRAFLDGYCDADGHRPADRSRHGERTYSSCSRRLIDDVRALHVMLGDPVSNVTTNRRAKPITIKGKRVKNARPLHTFAVWNGGRDGEGVLRQRPGLAEFLDEGDFTLARVLTVTDEGVQDTYDIEVQGAHNFVADGIVVHNSGFQSAITNVIQGRSPYSRRFATGSFPTGDFLKGPGNYSIGYFRGNPGHMAGTLNGVNVESRGGEGVVVGKRARGAGDGLFHGNIWHLKGYKDGGAVSGDAPFDLISPLGKHFDELVKGSYAAGTDYVPMDGLYQLHRGEAVTPAAQNSRTEMLLEIRGDGSKASDFVEDALNKGIATGRIRLVRK